MSRNTWEFGPFKVEKRSDFGSVFTFLVSVLSIPLSVIGFLALWQLITQSPEITLRPPSSVTFVKDECLQFTENYESVQPVNCLKIIAPMVYTNTGDPGKYDIVLEETVEFPVIERGTLKLGASYRIEVIDYISQHIKDGNSDTHCEDKPTEESNNLCELSMDWKYVSDSYPVSVDSGQVVAHETLFGAYGSKQSILNPDWFWDSTTNLEGKKYNNFFVKLTAQTAYSGDLVTWCEIHSRKLRKITVEDSKIAEWSVVECVTDDQ